MLSNAELEEAKASHLEYAYGQFVVDIQTAYAQDSELADTLENDINWYDMSIGWAVASASIDNRIALDFANYARYEKQYEPLGQSPQVEDE